MASDPREGTITWIGTATTLIRAAGFTILTDPNFLHRGELAWLGHGLVSRRLTEPSMGVRDLPQLDAVVLSHLHGDHFDRRARAGLDRAVPLVTTPHAARRLRSSGFGAAVGLATGAAHELRSADGGMLRVTSTPALHAHGLLGRVLPPVMGSILELRATPGSPPYRIWLSGDTLLHGDLARVPELAGGPVDLAVLHLGGTLILRSVLVTMDAAQGWAAMELVRPVQTVPVHHGDYTVFRDPLASFLDLVRRRPTVSRVREIRRGETLAFAAEEAPIS